MGASQAHGFAIFQDPATSADHGSVGNDPAAITTNDTGEIQVANQAGGANGESIGLGGNCNLMVRWIR